MKKFLSMVCIIIIGGFITGCETDRDDITLLQSARISEDWVRDAIIYEIYPRSFSPEGNFAGIEDRLPELKELGVTVLWLMPIHPVGEVDRKGTLGSPYSVRDYFDVNPEFGTMEDFKSLLNAAHDHGFKLILDLVANHTAWDNPLLEEHPDWYVQDEEGNIVYPEGTDWWDVADLNYDNPEVWEYMKEVMRFWVEDVGVDGFRCDVSELVPIEFWEEARDMLDDIKPVMMISEGTMPAHHLHAFDITYSWNIYHNLSDILYGDDPATVIDELLEIEAAEYPAGSLRMRFKSNHDENAWDAPAVEKWGPTGAKAVGVLVTTMPGVPLLYNGDEVGNPLRLELFEKIPIDWDRGEEYREFYTQLFELYNTSISFRRGNFLRIGTTKESEVYSFIRTYDDDHKLVFINLKPEEIIFDVEANSVLDAVRLQSGTLRKELGDGDDIVNILYDDDMTMTLPEYSFVIYDLH